MVHMLWYIYTINLMFLILLKMVLFVYLNFQYFNFSIWKYNWFWYAVLSEAILTYWLVLEDFGDTLEFSMQTIMSFCK